MIYICTEWEKIYTFAVLTKLLTKSFRKMEEKDQKLVLVVEDRVFLFKNTEQIEDWIVANTWVLCRDPYIVTLETYVKQLMKK